uniref:Rho GTPase activating protein 31 n=1 Tax=Sparus aurata TaxID=8175 RepID=A0A671TPW5_SPAAU
MKNKGTKQKTKKKGSENAFGCDLIEHLQSSGHDVPQVLKKCAEFIEEHGIVDGIYRLSGVTSNIQRLRQEFSSEACPDLTKEVYLQDIHCVGSLCKLYFRELPNPLLTYELYSKFTEVVRVQGDHERLLHIQRVVKELPTPHFRTLEYLTKHLAHLATLSTQTNMHTRNLALVWAPNLLRCKDIESSSGNGDMAFQAVRIQQSVVEFILNHTEQIFSGDSKYATLPISGQSGPMKLMSLEEAQARSLSPNHPVRRERQRENSLPDTSTATLYHTVIDISDSKRKFSGKSKKWKSIFNLGRSVDSKGKLSRNGSVFIRSPGITEKAALRPSRSMESLCSLPTDDDRTGNNSPSGGIFVPDVKSRTLGSDSLYDLSEHDQNWEFKGNKAGGATGGWSSSTNQKGSPGASAAPQKTLPEQLKVYKGDDLSGYKPTSPKNRRMLYSGSSHNSSSRPSFPGSFFPLESSPRHQRRAVNISEPFAVSVPLRVSAVISSNSTPCRGLAKDKAATLNSPSLSLLFRENSSNTSLSDHVIATGSNYAKKQPSESDILFSLHKNAVSSRPADVVDEKEKTLSQKITSKMLNKDDTASSKEGQLPFKETCPDKVVNPSTLEDTPAIESSTVPDEANKNSEKHESPQADKNNSCEGAKKSVISEVELIQRLSVCLEERQEGKMSPPAVDNKQSLAKSTEHLSGNVPQTTSSKPKTKWTYLPSVPARVSVNSSNTTQPHTGKCSAAKQKNTASSQRFYRQMSYEAEKREENYFAKHRPYSLNLDLGQRCIRDISNQQNRNSTEFSSCQRGLPASPATANNGLSSELELFLSDRQAPLRRNSAPVSVSSVRTAFMIKTCQAKAVPVVPPKVQYSQIPHSSHENDFDAVKEQEKEHPKVSAEKSNAAPSPMMSDLKEELENKEPSPKHQKHPNGEKCAEAVKNTSTPELPVITRRHAPSLEVFVDCPRPNRSNILQRPSFRNRQRPQSLILLSPPFPIMDYPPSGDDGKLLSSIKNLNDTSTVNVFSKEMVENFRTPEGIALQNKMTIPKSGQRLETSTSCFYQPQRRSMIFDSRSHRQIE